MKKLFLLFFLVLGVAAFGEETKTEPKPEEKPAVKAEDIVNKRLTLMDEKLLEVYRFYSNGAALAQVGKKRGSIASPVWQWKIENGYLVLSNSGEEKQRFELVERETGFIKFKRRTGDIVRFEIQKLN